MKKLVVLVVLLVCLIPGQGVYAMDIAGVYYNTAAADNEAALTIEFSKGLKAQYPDLTFRGDAFVIRPQESTIADVENRIVGAVMDKFVRIIPLSQVPADEPASWNPPQLRPHEWIVGNKLYRTTYYFAIHIFSLKPPALNFTTRFQRGRAGPIAGNWWEE